MRGDAVNLRTTVSAVNRRPDLPMFESIWTCAEKSKSAHASKEIQTPHVAAIAARMANRAPIRTRLRSSSPCPLTAGTSWIVAAFS
jgi:hypothetical protein